MNNKHLMKKLGALLMALGLTLGATGCDFVVPDSVKDLNQRVAKVDITATLAKDDTFTDTVAEEVATLISNNELSTSIPKRDLVASFMSTGYTYINNYGMSYEQAFTTLMDGLANRKIMTQYAVAHYIQNRPEGAKTFETFKTEELANASDDEKALIEKFPEVLTMKYYLTDYGKTDEQSMKPYFEAIYGLQQSINSTLDSSEQNYIKASGDAHTHEDSRTTPTGVNTEKEDYLPLKDGKLDYGIYTGRNTLDSCGVYEKIDGSSSSSRMSAYNNLLANLQGYGLIKKDENTSDMTKLEYYYMELSSTLGQALINKYYEKLEAEAITDLEANDYAYVTNKYAEILESQTNAYTEDPTAFEAALDGLSDTSFLLYGLQDYGFVYNVLLPFSDMQTQQFTAIKSKGLSGDALFNARKQLLNQIEAKDLRTAWFCAEEAEHYAYEVEDTYYGYDESAPQTAYLFFENNLTNADKYETLDHYFGQYPYQGTVTFNEEESKYEFEEETFNVDEFIAEMEGYINYALNSTTAAHPVDGGYQTSYDKDGKNTVYTTDGVVDYSKFVYYKGQVDLTETSADDYFNPATDAYKALSAVNELMFAFSTDTGCLNKYMGYVVAPDKTSFVSEFEYAAQYVVKQGVGAYAVAPSEYGWHIIYCAYKYDGVQVYSGFNKDEIETVGTFSNLFYESLKAKNTTAKATDIQTKVLQDYKDATTLYKKAYKDLMEIDQ
ncbi:MAG: hypothetical protein IJ996_02940 [Clostridia bacterium]|nr:hypothetical protein [Clostridia bacterium]